MIEVFALLSVTLLPVSLVFIILGVVRSRKLKRLQEKLEAEAMARGTIPPPLPKVVDGK